MKRNRQGVRQLDGPRNGKREFVVHHACNQDVRLVCLFCESSSYLTERCECRYRCSVCGRIS